MKAPIIKYKTIFSIVFTTYILLSSLGVYGQFRTGIIHRHWNYDGVINSNFAVGIVSYPQQPADTTQAEYYGIYTGGILTDSVPINYFPTVNNLSSGVSEFQPCFESSDDTLSYTIIESNSYDLLRPNQDEGYQLVIKFDQNSPDVLNITDPEVNGSTMLMQYYIWADVPDYYPISHQNVINMNSGVTACVGEPFQYMFGHVFSPLELMYPDLAYPWDQSFSLQTPLKGGNSPDGYLDQTFAMEEYEWNEGYSLENPLGEASVLTFSESGLLEGICYEPGIYTVGIRVDFGIDGNSEGYFITNYDIEIVDDCEPTPGAVALIEEQLMEETCNGLEATFTSPSEGALAYLWDFGDESTDLDTSTVSNPVYIYPEDGTYSVTLVTNPFTGCADTTSTDFTFQNPTFNVELSDLIVECIDGENNYSLQASGYPESAETEWSYSNDLEPSFIGDSILIFTDPSMPFLTTVNYLAQDNGCISEVTSEISINEITPPNIILQTDLCTGLTYEFQMENFFELQDYQWDFGVSNSEADTSTLMSPVFTFPEEGLYTITLTTSMGNSCPLMEQTEVLINSPFELEVSSNSPQCYDQQGFDFSILNDLSEETFYFWQYIDANTSEIVSMEQSSSAIDNYSFPSAEIGEVIITVSEFGCFSFDTIFIEIIENPTINILPFEASGCAPLSVDFSAVLDSDSQYAVEWFINDESVSEELSFQQSLDTAGVYSVALNLLDSFCPPTSESTLNSLVTTFEVPVSGLSLSNDAVYWPENSVEISSLTDAENCVFTLGNGDVIEDCNATAYYDEPGVYEITQTLTSSEGCVSESIGFFTIWPNITVPNVISPDSDGDASGTYASGLNDGWFLNGIEYVDNINVSIFDRWGSLVYEDASYSNDQPFKGFDLNGNVLNDGVYFYTIETSRGERMTGSLTILRSE